MSGCDAYETLSTRLREGRMRRWICRMASVILHGLALTVAFLACGSLPIDRNAQSKIAYVFIPCGCVFYGCCIGGCCFGGSSFLGGCVQFLTQSITHK